MEDQQNKKEFDVGMLVDDDIVEDQRKKQDGDPDDGDQRRLGKFTQPGFSVYLPVGTDQGVEHQPENRDDGYSVIEFFIPENDI